MNKGFLFYAHFTNSFLYLFQIQLAPKYLVAVFLRVARMLDHVERALKKALSLKEGTTVIACKVNLYF